MHAYSRVVIAVLVLALAGCASPGPQSTKLTTDDLLYTSDQMREKLGGSAVLSGRTAGSPAMVIVTDKVVNLTDDIITPAEELMIVARVRHQTDYFDRPIEAYEPGAARE